MGQMEDVFCLCLSSSCVFCNNIGCHSLYTCGFALQSTPAVQVHLNLTEVKVDSSQNVCVRQKGSRERVFLQQDAECRGLSSTSRPISNNLSSLYIGTIPPNKPARSSLFTSQSSQPLPGKSLSPCKSPQQLKDAN